MSFQQRFPEDNAIWDYSNPHTAQMKATQIYGQNAILYRSKAKNKKYAIVNPAGKIVNFGQMGYEDFTKHKDPVRRLNYLTRTANMKGKWKDDGYSANNLSRNILW
jgi:hypothetical protein